MHQLEVQAARREDGFTYPIYFTDDFDGLGPALEEAGLSGRKMCVVTDSNVAPLYLEAVENVLRKSGCVCGSFVFPAGEDQKNLQTVQEVYGHLISQGMDRKSLLCALGGGVTGDLTGFTAATYLRGIDFIQIPTTLLAQVDSSVGGKTGVDFSQYKNMVGAFHQPGLVYMNIKTLQTLKADQFACGMGEVLKTGLLADASFYREICEAREAVSAGETAVLEKMIRHCCRIKADIVSEDPTEQGRRAILNLGHTVGHAVEKLKNFSLLHGQCVAIGLAAAAKISLDRGMISEEELEEILTGLKAFGLPVSVEGLPEDEILFAMRRDKKMENGRLKFILMNGIGNAVIEKGLGEEELRAGIRFILHTDSCSKTV